MARPMGKGEREMLDNLREYFQERVRAEMQRRGWDYRELARRMGCTPQWAWAMVNKTQSTSLKQYARALYALKQR